MKLNNATVVITGASSGIGRATALRFAKEGSKVVLAARSADALEEVAEQCRRRHVEALVVPTDVTDASAVEALALAAVERFGGIDVWVNDAAVAVFGPFEDLPLEDFRRVLTVGIMGYVHGARAALAAMRKQGKPGKGRGVVVNVASVIGEVPQPYNIPYGMAKAAVRSLGFGLRQELMLQKSKIAVVTVSPPTIDTPFFQHAGNYSGRAARAMPPVYPPQLVAKAIVRAARKPKREVVVGTIANALAKQHRAAPESVEATMALQADAGQLSKTESAPASTGTLYSHSEDVYGASVDGGWKGTKKTGGRVLVVAGLAAGAAVYALSRPTKH
jgi:short-subunit dehydrogenase